MNSVSNTQKSLSRWSFGCGILVIILGMIAIAAPYFAGLSINALIAALLIIAGVTKTMFAFKADSFGSGTGQFLFGGLTVLCGVGLVLFPMFGLASITLLLISYFLIDGTFTVSASLTMRPTNGWGWMLVNGLITIALGIVIASDWPVSGVWAIGLLLGVRLVMSGFVILMLARAAEAD
ncbi:MAG: uncharacterized membrane protein HdeD (DUF308 family) [Shewanella sp.]|jgi:uncharacterized membrane protein HdeD (DUF308 family)